MRAVICSRFDGIDALELGELTDPAPGPDQVLVDVHAAALSFMDTLMVAGRYQMKPELPFVPGSDAAGVVLAVGDGVKGVRVGDRVACSHWHGGMAERMVVPERGVVKLPDGVGFEVGSSVRYAYGTAHYALVNRAQLRPGETVFVSGAAGGIGLAAVDVACHGGATVIAGTSSAAKGRSGTPTGRGPRRRLLARTAARTPARADRGPWRRRVLRQCRRFRVRRRVAGDGLGWPHPANRIHERRSAQPRHEPAAAEELQRGGMLLGRLGGAAAAAESRR